MSGYRDEYRKGAREFWWTLPRALIALLAVIVASFLIAVAVTPLTIGFSWFSGEANIRSFEHVREVYRDTYTLDNDLKAIASNACLYKGKASEATKAGKTSLADSYDAQAAAIEGRFAPTKAEYDALMADHFRAAQVKPGDLPRRFPSLSKAEANAGC